MPLISVVITLIVIGRAALSSTPTSDGREDQINPQRRCGHLRGGLAVVRLRHSPSLRDITVPGSDSRNR